MKKIAVEIFIPCFIDQMFPETGFNMVKVLKKLGCDVHYNPKQTCCGQPAFNAGYFEEASEVGAKLLEDLDTGRYIVAPSASCVGMVKNSYEKLFQNTANLVQFRRIQSSIYEFTEFLDKILKVDKIQGASLPVKATYHDSCSALRECKIKEGPRKLLSNVKGLELVEMQDTETCCGFGGTFAVKFGAISAAMAEQKIENALSTEAEVIISTDSSCLMHLEAYATKNNKKIKLMHIADVLASGW
jgi:L-lactate dehydrogenase complex protein LldE